MTSRDFWSKIGQYSNASGIEDFKVKGSQQTPKDVKLSALKNGYLRFFELLGFWPPKPKFRFFKNKCPKNSKCYRYLKNRSICYRSSYVLPTVVQNFKPKFLFLAVKLLKNRLMVMTSFFETWFLKFLIVLRQNERLFQESWDKTEQNRYGFKRKFWLSIFDLFDLNLTCP